MGGLKLSRFMPQDWVPISFPRTNPAGLAAGSRWSVRVKGADHWVNARRVCTQNGCQSRCKPVFGYPWKRAVFTCARAVLASLRDASIFGSRARWSFPTQPRNDHRLPAANPAGLNWAP
jgi:hypothetical protein